MISTHWSFNFSAWFIVVTALAWLISIGASWLQWKRRGKGKRVLFMEILRLLIVTLICVMLFKPELVKEIPRTQPPHVVILTDASGSMLTRDVTLDDKSVVTRADWLKANNTAAHWKPISDKGKVTVENFAAPPAKPSADAGTDLNDAVMKLLTHEDNLKAVLVLTDGDWNLGDSPVVAATKFSARDIPIYTVGIGGEQPLPDLVLEHSSTPAYGILGDQITVPFKIQSYLSRQVDTTVTMSDMHGVVS
ncbi:MAG TPA: vWA domain-containing protein, partial [Chthoniobacteraceae bacterium]|nr:vWA domain-containing protein [Chthoniobacteraceae bacterium]